MEWKVGTLKRSELVAKNVRALTFELDGWTPHMAGQHYDIRLTSEDGYQAERSYSAASPPEEKGIVEFGIELINDGEVSPYLFAMKPGDQVEMRGPIGGHFVWSVDVPGELCLIGAGTGMVPLVSMLRHRMKNLEVERSRKAIFLTSVGSPDKLLYIEDLLAMSGKDRNLFIVPTFTRIVPPSWDGFRRRVDSEMLREVFKNVARPMFYVCGPTSFVESVVDDLVFLGFNSHVIKTERFG